MTLTEAHAQLIELCHKHLPTELPVQKIGVSFTVVDERYTQEWRCDIHISIYFTDRRPAIVLTRIYSFGDTADAALDLGMSRAEEQIKRAVTMWKADRFWYSDPMR